MFRSLSQFYSEVPNWFRRVVFIVAVLLVVLVGKDTLWPPAIKTGLEAQIKSGQIVTARLDSASTHLRRETESRFTEIDRKLDGMSRYMCLQDPRNARLAGMDCH